MPDNQNADSYPQPIPVINSLSFQSGWQSNPTIETIPLDENLYMPGVNNAGDTLLKKNSLAALRPLLRPELMPTDLGVTYKGYWLLIGSQNFPGGSAGNQTYTQSLTCRGHFVRHRLWHHRKRESVDNPNKIDDLHHKHDQHDRIRSGTQHNIYRGPMAMVCGRRSGSDDIARDAIPLPNQLGKCAHRIRVRSLEYAGVYRFARMGNNSCVHGPQY